MIADAVDDRVIRDRRQPAHEAAGGLIEESVQVPERAQQRFLKNVLDLGVRTRLPAQLEMNERRQPAPVRRVRRRVST